MIQVAHLSKAYDSALAVDDLNFEVGPGRVLGLIGPNGAGKTTTLRSISGIIPADEGRVQIGESDLQRDPLALKQKTAYVADDPQLFNDLTVRQHFAFTASAYGVADWTRAMAELLDQFELRDKINARGSELSRGMRQKLAVACAYLYRPQALLLDEPMTGLDPRGIRVLKSSIQQQAERGAAVIISSHLLAMVEDICSDVLILESGRRRFQGTLADLKKQFSQHSESATLEEIFFQAVDRPDSSRAPAAVQGAEAV